MCSPKAIAEADISSVSLGSTGNGASTAIMAVSSGSSHWLCSRAPYPDDQVHVDNPPVAPARDPGETRSSLTDTATLSHRDFPSAAVSSRTPGQAQRRQQGAVRSPAKSPSTMIMVATTLPHIGPCAAADSIISAAAEPDRWLYSTTLPPLSYSSSSLLIFNV